ncbi:response regulator [Pelagivirga sediminicola]|uniref:Response regulator n=1 Tax=Pelagivirga sediminicola TaxID=2170575 RepID=A0A2T7GAF1_9RHOB|nr:response regulator [Pelagivirga sediminicola]PVA11402.1 response regulator [Pelagivirga sediminicola]
MDDLPGLTQITNPTAARPLLGMTILVVEDSLYACDAMRLMCLHSGARIRRADCLRSARRHLQVYRPTAVIIDLGLPDGSGLDLIAELTGAEPRVTSIIATSGLEDAEAQARAAGADAFLAKPLTNLGVFQQAVLSTLPADRQSAGPRALRNEDVYRDPLAYRDDMVHVSNLLDEHSEGPVLDYVAQFLSGVARSADDAQLAAAAEALAAQQRGGAALNSGLAQVAGLVQERLASRAAM